MKNLDMKPLLSGRLRRGAVQMRDEPSRSHGHVHEHPDYWLRRTRRWRLRRTPRRRPCYHPARSRQLALARRGRCTRATTRTRHALARATATRPSPSIDLAPLKWRLFLFFLPMLAVFIAAHIYLYRRLLRRTRCSWPKVVLRIARAVGVLALIGLAGSRTFTLAPRGLSITLSAWLACFLYLLIARLSLGGVARVSVDKERRTVSSTKPGRQLDPRRRACRHLRHVPSVRAAGAHRAAHSSAAVAEKRRWLFAAAVERSAHRSGAARGMGERSRRSHQRAKARCHRHHRRPRRRRARRNRAIRRHARRVTRAAWCFLLLTGNHDHYAGVTEWVAFVEKLGIQVLRNRNVALEGFDIIGTDDWGKSPNGRPPRLRPRQGHCRPRPEPCFDTPRPPAPEKTSNRWQPKASAFSSPATPTVGKPFRRRGWRTRFGASAMPVGRRPAILSCIRAAAAASSVRRSASARLRK